MKKFICVIMAVMLICAPLFGAYADMQLEYDGTSVMYTGSVYDLAYNDKYLTMPLPPIIFNDRALVPVRELFEAADATVTYNEKKNKEITVSKDDLSVVLHINDNVAYVDGKKVNIPDGVAPKLINKTGESAKTMVPVRFISESIGLKVEFSQEKNLISIYSDEYKKTDDAKSAEQKASPTPSPKPEKPMLERLTYTALSSNQICVVAGFDRETEPFSCSVLSSPTRLVVDVPGAALGKVSEKTDVGRSGVEAVRLGYTSERVRIVVDCKDLYSYEVVRTNGNDLKISAVTDDKKAAVSIGVSDYAQKVEKVIKGNRIPSSTPKPAVSTAAPEDTSKPSTPKPTRDPSYSDDELIVVLDAGHGGSDPGAIGELPGEDDDEDDENVEKINEKDLTLSITKKIQKRLKNAGVAVELTRTGDTLPSLSERPAYANAIGAALFVSIHINAATSKEAEGIETYYADENNGDSYGITSKELAQCLLGHLIAETGAVRRGVKEAAHAVTRRSDMPASLVECGFITNEEELKKMCDDAYQEKIAKAVADAVVEMLAKVSIPEKTGDETDKTVKSNKEK